jgi:hypothetical protein
VAVDTRTILSDIEKHLKQMMQFEIKFQNHVASGRLMRSCSVEAGADLQQLEITGYAEDYSGYVSEGRRRGVRGVPLRALITWVMIKGMADSEKKAKSIAFAIMMTIKKEGIPTRNSQRLAPRRTGWIDAVLEDSEEFVNDKLSELYMNEIEVEMTNFFKKYATVS